MKGFLYTVHHMHVRALQKGILSGCDGQLDDQSILKPVNNIYVLFS